MKLITIILLCIISCMLTPSEEAETLNISRVRVVDYKYANFNETDKINIMFRSNVPEDETHTIFEYDKLVDYMTQIAKKENLLRFDPNIYIVDFSLLASDDKMRITEALFWDANPSKGHLSGWEVVGEDKSPLDLPLDKIIAMSKNLDWMDDNIDAWVDELYTTLNNFSTPYNLMLLVHCHYGKDRTGEISGAYELKYNRKSWQEVLATNWETTNERIDYWNQKALLWYCYHLQYHRGYTHLNCTNDNLNKATVIVPDMVGWDLEDDDDMGGWEISFISLVSFITIITLMVCVITVVASVVLLRKRLVVKCRLVRSFIYRRINDCGNNQDNKCGDGDDDNYGTELVTPAPDI